MRMPLTHAVTTLPIFAAIWLLWSGLFTPLVLALGALSCLLVTGLAWRVGFVEVGAWVGRRITRLVPYWSWLLKEIALANLAVARVILHPRLPISPTIVRIDARALSTVGQAILANAITLTPGAMSIDVEDGQIEVHCLDRAAAEDLLAGGMLRRVAELD